MTYPVIREGYAIEAWRVPPGETGTERWDRINSGLSRGDAEFVWNFLAKQFPSIKLRMVEIKVVIEEVKDA